MANQNLTLTLLIILLLIPVGIFAYSQIDNSQASVENAYILKETVTELTNDGKSKYVLYHLVLDCHTEPKYETVSAKLKFYGKNNKYLGSQSYLIYGYSDNVNLTLPKYKGGIKKVKITIVPYSNKLIYLKDKLCSLSVSKLKKTKTTIDRTYEIKSYSTSTNDFDNSYENSYSNDYDSYYDDSNTYNSYASEEVSGGSFVASKNSDKFHESSCGHAERIKSSNRVYFESRQEALNSGYSPCKHCNP